MMWIVVKALILTLIVGVVGIFSKNRMSVWWYAIIFILMLISQWAFSSKLSAEEYYGYYYEMTAEAREEIQLITKLMQSEYGAKALKPADRQYYEGKLKFHQENALRTFNDAKDRCWWLPKLDDRENARYCFTALIAGISPLPPQSKLVAIIVATLAEYGLDCINEWEYIQNKLYWSQYHYELAEFYEELLKNA